MNKIFSYKRSWQSKIVEKVIPFVLNTVDERDPDNYRKALINSQQHYEVPTKIRKKFSVHSNLKIDDQTLELLPDDGHIERTIYYIHGGGYWWQPLSQHYKMLRRLSNQNHARIIMPIYPKAPAHTANEVLSFILKNYKKTIAALHLVSSSVVLMGDSAGGGLCLSLLQLLDNTSTAPIPKHTILFSPWLDLTNSNPYMSVIQPHDPMLNIKPLAFQGIEYAGSMNPLSPIISPINADYSKLPVLHIFSGTHDILYADVKKLSEANYKNVNCYIFPKMNHVFVAIPIPEAKKALRIVSQIIQK